MIGERDRPVDRLLDDHDGHALVAQRSESVLHATGGIGCETQGQLVDEQESWRRDQGHRQRQHVLLAAGEVARALRGALVEAREQIEHVGERRA